MANKTEIVLEKYRNARRDSLIPILQEIQDCEGFLSEKSIMQVSHLLNLPAVKIYGLATFYDQFRFEPLAKYNFRICRGTSCHVLGSLSILEHIEKLLGVKQGQKSRDGKFSIEVVTCLGACGHSPLLMVNDNYYPRITSEGLAEIVEHCRNAED
jgi:NADH-quinone oxidoreductase subunit E